MSDAEERLVEELGVWEEDPSTSVYSESEIQAYDDLEYAWFSELQKIVDGIRTEYGGLTEEEEELLSWHVTSVVSDVMCATYVCTGSVSGTTYF